VFSWNAIACCTCITVCPRTLWWPRKGVWCIHEIFKECVIISQIRQVLKAVTVKATVFWDVTPCSPVIPLWSSALTTEAAGFSQAYVTGVRLDIITLTPTERRWFQTRTEPLLVAEKSLMCVTLILPFVFLSHSDLFLPSHCRGRVGILCTLSDLMTHTYTHTR